MSEHGSSSRPTPDPGAAPSPYAPAPAPSPYTAGPAPSPYGPAPVPPLPATPLPPEALPAAVPAPSPYRAAPPSPYGPAVTAAAPVPPTGPIAVLPGTTGPGAGGPPATGPMTAPSPYGDPPPRPSGPRPGRRDRSNRLAPPPEPDADPALARPSLYDAPNPGLYARPHPDPDLRRPDPGQPDLRRPDLGQPDFGARRGDGRGRGAARGRGARQGRGGATGRTRVPPLPVLGGGAAVLAAAAAGGVYVARRGDDEGTELSATVGDQAGDAALDGAGVTPGAPSGPGAGSFALPRNLDVEHLLRRTTYGPTDALRAEVRRLGVTAWLGQQLAPAGLADPGGDAVAAMFPDLALTSAAAATAITDQWAFQRDLAACHLGRAFWSSRQLLEVMVGFWSDHFTIPCPGRRAQLTRHRFDADVIRKGALGRFEDLLQASAVHPAMIEYLDLDSSTGKNPNERYARELLEQHTVGPSGGFTEKDVQQAALMFTGFQVKAFTPRFVASAHWTGPVALLGFTHANDSRDGGRDAAVALLRHLARHPATAAHLCRKLAVRFVADDPPPALVTRLVKVYLDNDTHVAPVLTALLSSPEFAASGGRKLRRPLERLAATVRTLGIQPGPDKQALVQLHWTLSRAGQAPLGWPSPGGYPDVASAWQSPAVALQHFNVTAQLVHGWWPEGLSNPGPGRLLRVQASTRDAVVEAVGTRLLGRALTAVERSAATTLLAATKLPVKLATGSWEQKETIGLVATLLLNSPSYLAR